MEKQWTTHTLAADLGRDEMLRREWLLTNGTGAYSMGTALGANTRRYHGLLVAAAHPPVGRVLGLNQVLDQLVLAGEPAGPGESKSPDQTVELSTCLFRGEDGQLVRAPRGDEVISEFARGLTVQWTYRWGQVTIERELVLHDGEQAATLHYGVSGLEHLAGDATLRISPMLTLRDFHGLRHRGDAPGGFAIQTTAGGGCNVVVRHDQTVVNLAAARGRFIENPDWWYALTYPRDTYRGQDDREDYFVPGHFDLPLKPTNKTVTATLTVALGDTPAAPRKKPGRAARLQKTADALPGDPAVARALAIAADDFVVKRVRDGKKLTTIMAGYPWFADWGRDTFIALPGLLLAAGRRNEARDTLRAFAGVIKGGLVPNRFDDYTNQPHYNTVDASLWYVKAGLDYARASGTWPDWLARAITDIVENYAAGTHASGHDGRPIPIAMEPDGLIAAGDDHSQLTWMDAACGDAVFTPRPGKCVEINALWYHALVGLTKQLEAGDAADLDQAQRYQKLAAKVKRSFVKTFWSAEWNRLIDHVTPSGEIDPSLRPNMAIACSLPHSPLPATKRRLVLAAIKAELLTPMGLRTLPPDDPNYHPHYAGPQFERDQSYHQGTVWPWLLGPYAEGILRAGKFSKKAKAEAATALQPLLDRLMHEGLGQLHEIFDASPGSAPGTQDQHAPRGCPAQAWSIAELVRVSGVIHGG